jgi:glutathione S-transferase
VRRATPASTRLAGALLLLRRQLAHGEPTIADYHRRRAETALSVLDSQLAHRNYLCAAKPTIADLFCYGDVAFAELCAFDLHRWTSAVNWTERLTALTGFKAPFASFAMENAELS